MSVPKEVRAFGAEVRRRRESLGWTLPDFAKRSGLTANYIGAVEMGIRDPSMSTLVKIAKGFGVPLSDLLGAYGFSPVTLECLHLVKEAPPDVREAIEDILTFSLRKLRR